MKKFKPGHSQESSQPQLVSLIRHQVADEFHQRLVDSPMQAVLRFAEFFGWNN